MRLRRIILLATLLIICMGCTLVKLQPENYPTHVPQIVNSITQIWSLENIRARQDNFTPLMVASSGKIILIASMADNSGEHIICLDGETGNLLWQINDDWGIPSMLVATTDGVYVGYSGIPHVVKYDLATGEVKWEQKIAGRAFMYFFVLDSEVNVLTSPEMYYKLSADTGIVTDHVQGKSILISTNQEIIVHTTMNGLKSFDLSGAVNWAIDLDREIRLAPVFTHDTIYVRTGTTLGSLYAIKRSTSEVLWKTDAEIISNIAYSINDERVYVIAHDGRLLQIDRDSGEQAVLANLTANQFVLNGEDDIVGGYEVAFDDSTKMIYVLLGDSKQLFAFQVR